MREESVYAQRPLQARDRAAQLRDLWIADSCSPIESLLGTALLDLILEPGEYGPPRFCNLFLPSFAITSVDDLPPQDAPGFVIAIQPEVGIYRPDFLISVRGDKGKIIRADVECDGISYHGTKEEQFEHDRTRDRFMASLDIRVLRFSGDQIRSDARACARECLSILWRLANAGLAA